MPNENIKVPKQVTDWLSKCLPKTFRIDPMAIRPLTGDGSVRQFFRMTEAIHTTGKSFVLLWDPEWKLSADYAPHQEFLKDCGINVPEFYFCDTKHGFLVMEDLGDQLLQQTITSKDKLPSLFEAINMLCRFQMAALPKNLPACNRRFNQDKYLQELLFTQEHLVEKFMGLRALSAAGKTAIKDFCGLIEKIGPLVFSHRDFHVRNLMVKDAKLFVIDFQDARLGPVHYDLASLLFDPYMDITATERETLLAHYESQLVAPLRQEIRWDSFARDLELIGLQRLLKAAGSYASFFTGFNKKTHLTYIRVALTRAQSIIKNHPELSAIFGSHFQLPLWLEKLRDRVNIC